MNIPKISIIVPSYNQGEYLEATLTSIINQQYPNLELFVADGGSQDNSVDIIRKYENHITWWVSEKDKGQSDAINKGLERATGDIISWLCSDDLFTPGTFNKVANYFSQLPPDTGLIHGGSTLFKASGKISDSWGYNNPSLERNLAGMAFPQPSAFFQKKFLDIIGSRVNTDLHYGMDYDLFSRLACVCRFNPVPEIFSEYRLHDSSKSVKEQDRFIDDWSSVFINLCKNIGWSDIHKELNASGFLPEKVRDFYYPFSFTPDINILQIADKRKILFYHYCYVLKAFYWSGKLDKASELLKQLKEEYPYDWLKVEKDIPAIMKKLALPSFFLKALKKLKRL
jgi:glycosyltransferase involved in cell wall biosynthesis